MFSIKAPSWQLCFLTNNDSLIIPGRGSPQKFLPSYIEIDPVVSDKKSFKVFYMGI